MPQCSTKTDDRGTACSETSEIHNPYTIPAYLHMASSVVGITTCIACVVIMKTCGYYTKDIWFPGLSDTGRENPGYSVMLAGAVITGLIRLWTRQYIYRHAVSSIVGKSKTPVAKICMFAMYVCSHVDSVSTVLTAYNSVGDAPDTHNACCQYGFISSIMGQLLTILLYYWCASDGWMKTSMRVRMAAVAIGMGFMYYHVTFPEDRIRFVPYEEACARLGCGLANFTLQCGEPVRYGWKRADGKHIGAPYDAYDEHLFVKLAEGEEGELVHKTSMTSCDHCPVEGWIWSLWELLTILSLNIAEAMGCWDLLEAGRRKRKSA